MNAIINMAQRFVLRILTSVLLLRTCAHASQAATPNNAFYPPDNVSPDQDRQSMMQQVGVISLRHWRNGTSPGDPFFANYDEMKANSYLKLPEALLLTNGTRAAFPQTWWSQRRPEIVELFDREVYGRQPAVMPKVTWEPVITNHARVSIAKRNVLVSSRRLLGHVDNSTYARVKVSIELSVTLPDEARGPSPVILVLESGGFVALDSSQKDTNLASIAPMNPFAKPGTAALVSTMQANDTSGHDNWQSEILGKGWGYAELNVNSVQPDAGGESLRSSGIIGLMKRGEARNPEEWGVLRAWAWGASRVMDYLETDKGVDAKQVGIQGHSRFGKAALVAMAYDQRFAIAYISSSGEAGAKLYRRNYGEAIENIAAGEYYWMAGNFIKYGGTLNVDDLPVDSHELIALCAPRPVFLGNGADGYTQDGWQDPRGTFMAAVAASPVYELLGAKGLNTTNFPPVGTPVVGGDLAFRQHPGGHEDAPNWPTFLQFADRYIKSPGLK